MQDIQLDDDGNFRCAACGGRNFSEKRTRRAKVIGVTAGVATLGVAGAAAPLVAKKKLYCQACGTYNQMGNAKPYKPTTVPPTQGAASKPRSEPKQNTPMDTLLTMLGIVAIAAIGLAVSISSGSVAWAIICGLVLLLSGFGAFVTAINMRAAPPKKSRPATPRPAPKRTPTEDDLGSSRQGKYLEVKKRPPPRPKSVD
ncbi:hypothetical protein [Williamsia sp. 1135]|uniref:hypothetical protein n=1 Tax=Williamsia sp. 1135 TaxID=1889262 RepID=UPI000A0FA63F|nr:hypothetical protein [Williamsia sp. 1135]ORM29189.1 hypothetical protein BFL43_20360 [Williamsia sp. 1135]